MCKRDCIYAGTENIHFGAGQHCCNYVVAMLATDREQKTRLGALVKKYKLPSTHRKIKLLMMGENCPFYDPLYPGKKKPKTNAPILPRKPREKREYKAPADEEKLMELYEDGLSDEVYGFDIPVPVIGEDFDLAIIGTKGKWYDHRVSVQDPEPAA